MSPPDWISKRRTRTPLMDYWFPLLGQKVVEWRLRTNCAVGPKVYDSPGISCSLACERI